jgi:hypothetical protein
MDIFNGYGVEILLPDADAFLKVKETLTRIGVAAKKDNILYQSCHILHKQGHYAVVHFKELFALDGKPTDISDNDYARRNTIASLLAEWGLLTIVHPDDVEQNLAPLSQIKIISFKEKNDWQLVTKYTIGRKVKRSDNNGNQNT